MDKMNFKKAFTLAETLLTIMIIGILVALMLRAINRVNPDKDKVLFIKAYHATEAAIGNIINDQTKYDPTYLTDDEIDAAEAEGTELNLDFRFKPYPDATADITNANGEQQEIKNISQSQAVCYFLADQLNTVGAVKCTSNGTEGIDGANFRLSNGVCFYNWSGVKSNGSVDGVIDPTCTSASEGYVVRVFYDGKVTVPETATGHSNQSKAYEWLQNQTDVK